MKSKEWTAKVMAWLKRSISQYSPSFTYQSDLEMIMSIRQDPPCCLIQQGSAKMSIPCSATNTDHHKLSIELS